MSCTKLFIWTSYKYKDWSSYAGHRWQQCVTFVGKNDFIIAYNRDNIDPDYLDYILNINNLNVEENFIWINTDKDANLYNNDIINNKHNSLDIILSVIHGMETPNKHIIFHPFLIDIEFLVWYHKILTNENTKYPFNISYYHNDIDFKRKYANKAILYQFYNDLHCESIAQNIGIYNSKFLNKSSGYVAESVSDIYASYNLLCKQINNNNIVLKYAFGFGGLHQYYVSSIKDIDNDFKWLTEYNKQNKMVVEPNFNYYNNPKKVIYLGCQFYDGKVTEINEQLFNVDGEYSGAYTFIDRSKNNIENKIKSITSNIIQTCFNTKYCGGLDYAVQFFNDEKDVKIYLIDINLGRITSPQQTIMLINKLNIDINNIYWMKVHLTLNCKIAFKNIMNTLKRLNILFNITTKIGVYVNQFYSNKNDKTFIISIIAHTAKQGINFLKQVLCLPFVNGSKIKFPVFMQAKL